MSGAPENVTGLVDHLFRRQAGQMAAALVRAFGPRHLDLAEDVVHEALVKALEIWPFQGVPPNPAAWLMTVARNRAIDRMRRDARVVDSTPEQVANALDPGRAQGPFSDDQLAMMFLCCHPALARDARLALTLKVVCGFSVREIAAAFLAEEAAIAQRIVRAKRQIREQGIALEMPPERELVERLESVLEAVYLLFNEGYSGVRQDVAEEAIWLAGSLCANPLTARPETHALAALLLFHSARLGSRRDEAGDLVAFEHQDRSRWDHGRIARAHRHLERAMGGDRLSNYHLEAGIAAEYTAASIDWNFIIENYDLLYRRTGSPVVGLNRAIAITHRDGAAAGLAALDAVRDHPALAGYMLLPAALGWMWRTLGHRDRAAAYWREALTRRCSDAERRFVEKQLAALESA
jgi:RNA polymerase sigma-70 factor (ECF subfamily)